MTPILPVVDTNHIRYADFVRITTKSGVFRLATTPSVLTVPEVDSEPFDALGSLVQVGDAQRDIKSTANETQFTLVGLDTAVLGWILSQNVKGSQIEAWKGFFAQDGSLLTTGGQGGLYQYFNGYVTSFSISEQWMEEIRSFVGVVSVAASSVQLILKNRIAGRFTNDNSWQFFSPDDTSMDRVSFITNINYYFGKTPT